MIVIIDQDIALKEQIIVCENDTMANRLVTTWRYGFSLFKSQKTLFLMKHQFKSIKEYSSKLSSKRKKNDIIEQRKCIYCSYSKKRWVYKATQAVKTIMLCRVYVLSVYDYINYNPLTHVIVEKYEVNIHISYSILYFSRILFYFFI